MKLKKIFIIGIAILMVFLGYYVVFKYSDKFISYTENVDYIHKDAEKEVPDFYYNGVGYVYNENLHTVLFMGIDYTEPIRSDYLYTSGGQADVLILIIIDSKEQKVNTIQINRDTITKVNLINKSGSVLEVLDAQIAVAHSFGDGLSLSCKNTVTSVSYLMYDIIIDDFIALNMGGIPIIVDFMGGVEVDILEDFSQVDSSLIIDERINLNGNQAYHFIHERRNVGGGTNVERMERHKQFIDSFSNKFVKSVKNDLNFITDLYNEVDDYILSSMSKKDFINLVLSIYSYDSSDLLDIAGENNTEGIYAEFYANEEWLKKTVIDLFYTPVQ